MNSFKNGLILVLFVLCFASFFYGKSIGESSNPDMAIESTSEEASLSLKSSSKDSSFLKSSKEVISLPDGTKIEKESIELGISKESHEEKMLRQRLAYESLLVSIKRPLYGISLSYGYDFMDNKYVLSVGVLKSISEKTYLHAEIFGTTSKVDGGKVGFVTLF